jgi:hypothetical protein
MGDPAIYGRTTHAISPIAIAAPNLILAQADEVFE